MNLEHSAKPMIGILCGVILILAWRFSNASVERNEYKEKYDRAIGLLDAHKDADYINLSLYYNNQVTKQDVLIRKWYLPKKELDNRLLLWWLWEVKIKEK